MFEVKEAKRKLADGPVMLCEVNPKGAERFSDRVCESCGGPIMTHWLIPSDDLEKRSSYWCDPDGNQMCTGMKI